MGERKKERDERERERERKRERGKEEERDDAPLTSLSFPQGLFQPIRADVLMSLLGVGPNGALFALHRCRASAFLLVRQIEWLFCTSHWGRTTRSFFLLCSPRSSLSLFYEIAYRSTVFYRDFAQHCALC